MKLYEIPQEMEDLIDQETGEVTDPERYMALAREYENGLEYLALQFKNKDAEADALGDLIKNTSKVCDR